MDYSKLVTQAKKVKAFLDTNKDQYQDFHYRQFNRCVGSRLYHQPKTYKNSDGRLTFFGSSLINQQALTTLRRCFDILQTLDFISSYTFEPLPKQDSYLIKLEFGQQTLSFDQAIKLSHYYPIKGQKQQLTDELSARIQSDYHIDYQSILHNKPKHCNQTPIEYLMTALPALWQEQYKKMTATPTYVQHIQKHFSLLYDFQSIAQDDNEDYTEDRVVVFYGLSQQSAVKRDAVRMKGYLVHGFEWTDKDTDKGHFIGHSLGGNVDENLFPQKRQINRGQSAQGKIYRKMENYCAKNPGTFCFSRPIYCDFSTRPFILEYGLLTEEGKLWVEQFDNV